jgi:hypothetical protein
VAKIGEIGAWTYRDKGGVIGVMQRRCRDTQADCVDDTVCVQHVRAQDMYEYVMLQQDRRASTHERWSCGSTRTTTLEDGRVRDGMYFSVAGAHKRSLVSCLITRRRRTYESETQLGPVVSRA